MMSNSNMAPCGGLKIDNKTLGINSKGELYVKAVPSEGGDSSDDDSSTRVATEDEINSVKDEIGQILDDDDDNSVDNTPSDNG